MAALTKEQAIQKLKQFCSYQERCHFDVKQKLYELRVPPSNHDEIIAWLIEEDYLNEERFARQFAGGKFRMKGWGRKKIYQKLMERRISPYLLKGAFADIEEEQYLQTLTSAAEKKYELLKQEQYLVRRKKTLDYLHQKGFEPELANRILNDIIQKHQS